MKVALLGISHPHAAPLLTTLENLPEITQVHLWDSDPAVVAKPTLPASRKATTPTTDLDSILRQKDVDFAIVCVRHDQAPAISHRVIAAGKHLMAEKPVGMTSAEITGLQLAANRAGVATSVLYTRRLHPCMVAARKISQSGALGRLLTVECRFLTTQVRFRKPEHWLFQKRYSGGGILLWLGCHCLDLMYHVTGDEIVELGAALVTRSGEKIDVDDAAMLTLKFKSGAVGTFHAGYTMAYSGEGYVNNSGYDSYMGFNGTTGRIVWPDLDPRLVIESPPAPGRPAHREEKYEMAPSTSYGGTTGEDFFRLFFAAMRKEGPSPTTLQDAVRTARIIEAAAESSESGKFVKVKVDSSFPPNG